MEGRLDRARRRVGLEAFSGNVTLSLVTILAATGCMGDGLPEAHTPPGPPADPGDGLERLLRSFPEPLQKLNDAPLPSLVAAGTIDLWVSQTGFEEYSRVRARATGSRVNLPVGTTVLRVQRDERGRIARYTALIKRESGFNAPADLEFAAYDPSGQIAREDDGSEMRGPLARCLACHLTRAQDGFVFGRPDR